MTVTGEKREQPPQSHPLSRRTFLRQATGIGGGLLAAGLGIVGWRAVAGHAPPRAPAAKPNIILLTADSLRADHVGAYGYARPTTPHLDRLAAESTLFEYAFAPISLTGPSLASLHTGKYPREHFMRFKNGSATYRHTDQALAALLQTHGYQTAAFVSNHVLERQRSQMDKGFDHYDDQLREKELNRAVYERNAQETTAAVIRWLKEQARSPFFLWIHYIEPHGPYVPPPPYDTMFVGDSLYAKEKRTVEVSRSGPGRGGKNMIPNYQVLDVRRDRRGGILSYNGKVADYIARYDGEIRYLDEAIGHLLQALKAQGLYDTAWLLFSSDHGESLGEQGYYFQHGWRVTLELLRVPLLIRLPGKPAPRRVNTQVSLIDLMPTLLEAAGSKGTQELSGQSIFPLLQGENQIARRLAFSEIGTQYSLIDDHYQVLVGYDLIGFQKRKKDARKATFEIGAIPAGLFAYREDPVGEKDLFGLERKPAEARFGRLRTFLEEYLQRTSRVTHVGRPPVQDSAETRAILKQLGY